jgi:hypothetical protein
MQELGSMKSVSYIILFIVLFIPGLTRAQCDFVNDITGLSLSTLPTGAAADPSLFTQTYVLVDDEGDIVATNTTPDFYGLTPGLYAIYAVNYDNTESAAVNPLLAPGGPWNDIAGYSGCLDFTGAYGGCYQSVCDEITALETDIITNTTSGYTSLGTNTQEYCLVCGGTVLDVNGTGVFDLNTYPAAVAGADCEVVAMNYLTTDGAPVLIGDNFDASASAHCGDCWDFVARNLEITSSLPVEFLSINGSVEGNWNRLDWVTLSEVNTDKFIVERSEDGQNFEEIGIVIAAGNSNEELHYKFFDKQPLANLEYYRIKQVDVDGQFVYTPIVTIQRRDIVSLSLYPNPANDHVVVDLSTEQNSSGTVSLIDGNGKRIWIEEYDCISNGQCEVSLDLKELGSGIYCVLVLDNINDRVYQKRFVKK